MAARSASGSRCGSRDDRLPDTQPAHPAGRSQDGLSGTASGQPPHGAGGPERRVWSRAMLIAAADTFFGLTPAGWAAVTAFATITAAVGAFGTLIVAIVAARYAKGQLKSAGQQLDVMQQTREDETRPYVVVDVEPSEAEFILVNLVVQSIGRTAAHNVRVTFDPPLESTLTQFPPVAESVLVKEGISVMPPGRRIEALFDRQPDRNESNLPQRYDVTVNLDDARGRPQEPQRYVLDLQQLSGLRHVNVRGVHHVAKTLETIAGHLARWPDWRAGMRVTEDTERGVVVSPGELSDGTDRAVELFTGLAWLRRLVANPYVARGLQAIPPLRGWLQRRRAHEEALVRSLADASEPLGADELTSQEHS